MDPPADDDAYGVEGPEAEEDTYSYGENDSNDDDDDEYYDEMEDDALASEIAQLEQELQYMTPYEVGLTTEKHVSLRRSASQRDYVVTDTYAESDDDDENALWSSTDDEELVSTIEDASTQYDEVTVTTAELLLAQQGLRPSCSVKNDVLGDLRRNNKQQKEASLLTSFLSTSLATNEKSAENYNCDADDDSQEALLIPPSLRVAFEPGGSPVKTVKERSSFVGVPKETAVPVSPASAQSLSPLKETEQQSTLVAPANPSAISELVDQSDNDDSDYISGRQPEGQKHPSPNTVAQPHSLSPPAQSSPAFAPGNIVSLASITSPEADESIACQQQQRPAPPLPKIMLAMQMQQPLSTRHRPPPPKIKLAMQPQQGSILAAPTAAVPLVAAPSVGSNSSPSVISTSPDTPTKVKLFSPVSIDEQQQQQQSKILCVPRGQSQQDPRPAESHTMEVAVAAKTESATTTTPEKGQRSNRSTTKAVLAAAVANSSTRRIAVTPTSSQQQKSAAAAIPECMPQSSSNAGATSKSTTDEALSVEHAPADIAARPHMSHTPSDSTTKKKVVVKRKIRKVRKKATTGENEATSPVLTDTSLAVPNNQSQVGVAGALTQEEENKASEFRKMLKVGMPEDVVRQRMAGLHPKIVNAVFATTKSAPEKQQLQPASLPLSAYQEIHTCTKTAEVLDLTEQKVNKVNEFRKMLKIGMPEQAVRQRMVGVDPKIVEAVFAAAEPTQEQQQQAPLPAASVPQPVPAQYIPQTNSSPAAASGLTEQEESKANEFRKMLKIGMPEQAVRHRMAGLDPKIVNAVFATVVPTPEQPRQSIFPAAQVSKHIPPEQTVCQRMHERDPKISVVDRATPSCMVQTNSNTLAQQPATKLTEEEQATVGQFQQMLQIGLPEGAVRHRMGMLGADKNPKVMEAVFGQPPRAKSPAMSPSKRSIDHEVAQLDDEIKKIEAEIQAAEAPPEARPSMGHLLGAITNKANQRATRLEETGGELIMQDFVPEVKATQQTSAQLSTSMAEMISARATAREKRLADGGEKRMRKVVIKEKDEYKRDFSDIVAHAASMGRLTRLDEYTVEAVAGEKTPEQEWKSNGLLAIQWRSDHMSVIHEAARVGNEAKLPEFIVSNCPEERNEGLDLDANDSALSPRMRQLLELNKQAGGGQQKVDRLVLGRKETKPQEHLLIKPMQAYANIADVRLPRQAPPRVDPLKNAQKLSKMKQDAVRGMRPMEDISLIVAERAWERRARLDRPGVLPRVKEKCECPYCGTASPFQTFAYRELGRKHKEEMEEHERKRLERQRIREEKRNLQKAVAEAEAAIAAARAKAEAEAARRRVEEEAAAALAREREPPGDAPIKNSDHACQKILTKESEVSSSTEEPEMAPSDVESRVEQWNKTPTKKSRYARPNPADTGCACVIM